MLSLPWIEPITYGPPALLESYNALYLHEEVQMEGLVRSIGESVPAGTGLVFRDEEG